jgi:MoxR-like ATPase
MLETHGEHSMLDNLTAVIHADDVVRMAAIANRIHTSDAVRGYLIDLAEATRTHPDLLLGASPRATLFIQRATRTRAAIQGRDFVTPDDVKVMLEPILNHRMVLQAEAQMRGTSIAKVIEDVAGSVPVPGSRGAP